MVQQPHSPFPKISTTITTASDKDKPVAMSINKLNVEQIVNLDDNYSNNYSNNNNDGNIDTIHYSEKTLLLKLRELASIYQVSNSKLVRKIDWCVIPPFALLYFLAYFNRSSFGFVETAGIFKDLHITSLQFYASYAAFFAPYIIFQFFANMLLKRVRPHFWISISVFLYGAITLSSGFVHNYAAYVALHFLHGVVQAGSETAIFYILAHYYTAKEAQRRFSAIYSVSCLAGIVANLVAHGIVSNLQGHHNGWLEWRWAVVIYGAMTMAASIVLFFTLPDFPEGARFFDDNETFFLIRKLELYGGKSGYGLSLDGDSANFNLDTKNTFDDGLSNILGQWKTYWHSAIADPLIWMPAVVSMGISYSTYVYAFHEPVLMNAIGYGTTTHENASFGSLPWVVAFVWVNLSALVSEKLLNGKRLPVIALNLMLAIIGALIIFIPSSTASYLANQGQKRLQYAGCFLLVSGGYAALPMLLCWATMNVVGHVRKSSITAMQISFGSVGGIISIFTFYNHEQDITAPFAAAFGFLVLTFAMVGGYSFVCVKKNKEKRKLSYKEEFGKLSEKHRIMLGDKRPSFDYML